MINPIDLVLVLILVGGFIWGFTRGFVVMGFSLLAVLLGVLVGGKLSPVIMPYLFAQKYSQIGYVVLFTIFFTLIYFVIKKISYLVMDMVEFLELEWLDSLLGGLIGLFQFVIITGVILSLTYSTGIIKMIPSWNDIRLGGVLTETSQTIISFIAGSIQFQKL